MFVCPLPINPINLFRLKIFYLYLPAIFYFYLFFVPTENFILFSISRSKLFYRNPWVLSSLYKVKFVWYHVSVWHEHLHLEIQSIWLKSMLKSLNSWYDKSCPVSFYMKSRVRPIQKYQRVYKIFCKWTLNPM